MPQRALIDVRLDNDERGAANDYRRDRHQLPLTVEDEMASRSIERIRAPRTDRPIHSSFHDCTYSTELQLGL